MFKSILNILVHIGAAFAFLFSVSALAANWVYVTTSPRDGKYYYDSTSIRRAGTVATVWEKMIFSQVMSNGGAYRVMRFRYDCEAETSTTLNAILYKSDGVVIENFSWNKYEQLEEAVTPDTVGETRFNAICRSN